MPHNWRIEIRIHILRFAFLSIESCAQKGCEVGRRNREIVSVNVNAFNSPPFASGIDFHFPFILTSI